jgi:putative SOS response-associated peptidase YedK
MCGRFTLHTPKEILAARFAVDLGGVDLAPRYNVAPTQPVLAVRAGEAGARRAELMRWGLVPTFAKEAKSSGMINARVESAATRPAYRVAFRRHRCLILADGFYEWQRGGRGGKTPYWISLASGEPFAMAGLWSFWRARELFATEPVISCAILTAPANPAVAPIHDRMPVILHPEAEAAWIERGEQDVERLRALLVPVPAEALRAVPVGLRVNSPRNDGPDLIRPEDIPRLGF